jgi:hypothetical protein
MTSSITQLRLTVAGGDASDLEEIAELARQLQEELLDLDVIRVDPVEVTMPSGSKSGEAHVRRGIRDRAATATNATSWWNPRTALSPSWWTVVSTTAIRMADDASASSSSDANSWRERWDKQPWFPLGGVCAGRERSPAGSREVQETD